jgi:glycosyltransferase involved in cell wall biosynthesis
MEDLVSVIIPARKERFLDRTIDEIFKKADGPIEIVVALDGEDVPRKDNVKYVLSEPAVGMRTSINKAVKIATGRFIMKLDAHCALSKGFDTVLKENHEPKRIQIPRRKRLHAKSWTLIEDGRPDIDYMYLTEDLMGRICGGKNLDQELKKKEIDEIESFQGSCYFMEREYFHELGLLDDVNFGGSGHESQEITFKCWMNGGKVVRNKRTWYAHARLGRFYNDNDSQRDKSRKFIHVLYKQYKQYEQSNKNS